MDIRLENAIVEFELECQIRNFSPRTTKHYVNNTKRFAKYISVEYDNELVKEVTHRHIKAYFSFLKKMKNSISYINTILKSLRSFFKYCLMEDYISENPCERVGWMKTGKPLIKTFNDEEVLRMLKVYNGFSYLEIRNRAIIATFADTGIRNLELCMLREDDVMQTRIFVIGKGNKERYVPTSPLLQKLLIQFKHARELYFTDKKIHDDCFFLSRTGRSLCVTTNERIVHNAGSQAKVEEKVRCSPHTFRHYYAQKQLLNGLDIYTLSRVLGHESVNTTKIYLRSIDMGKAIEIARKSSPLSTIY